MYVCLEPACGKQFRVAKYLKEHQNVVHSTESHMCSVCSKKFSCFRYLKIHWKTHSDEREHECPECGKGFKTHKEMTRHHETHSEVRKYHCTKPNCGRAYKTASTLRIHLKIHAKNERMQKDVRYNYLTGGHPRPRGRPIRMNHVPKEDPSLDNNAAEAPTDVPPAEVLTKDRTHGPQGVIHNPGYHMGVHSLLPFAMQSGNPGHHPMSNLAQNMFDPAKYAELTHPAFRTDSNYHQS